MNTIPACIEIMSPAGSFESLMAAIQGGADAVYFGVGKLNMRARSSQNFSIDDLAEITRICRDNNVKSYLTLNTVVFDDEMDEIRSVISAAKTHHVNAIIASDMAVINAVMGAGLHVHASTQCNIANTEAVRYYARFCDVIVLARELSLDKMKYIAHRITEDNITGPSGKPVRLEAFVHGALCMSVSGKCYLSLDNMNYSANRGACLQPCRRKYTVTDTDDGHQYNVDGAYIMSPKDLCTITFLDKLLGAGISVLKIEGRGRAPEYVKTVTRAYRTAADAIVAGSFTPELAAALQDQVSAVYNRGFWEGYYMGKKTGEWTERYGSQAETKKEYVGKVTNFFTNLNVAEVKIETGTLSQGDKVLVLGPTTGVVEILVDEIRVDLRPVPRATKGQFCSLPAPQLLRRGDKLYKVIPADA